MASRLITANYPRIVRYLPNLDAAVRHFTSYLGQDANRIESTQEMIGRDGLAAVSAEVLMSDQRKTLSRIDGAGLSLTDIPYEQSKITGVNIDLSVLEQFAPGTEKTINIIPTVMDSLECMAQVCPTTLKKELKELFPGNEKLCKAGSSEALVTVITLSQHTVNDMSAWNIAVETEREQLLEKFITGAKEICQALNQAGYWADFIDPSSGAPYFGAHTNTTLFETDERYKSLGFDIDDLGCCKVIRHKQWGTHAYVGSLFTDAPMNLPVIQKLMQN